MLTLTQLQSHPAFKSMEELEGANGRRLMAEEIAGAFFLRFAPFEFGWDQRDEIVEIADEADIERVLAAVISRIGAKQRQQLDAMRAKCVPIEAFAGDSAPARLTLGEIWGAKASGANGGAWGQEYRVDLFEGLDQAARERLGAMVGVRPSAH